MMTKIEAINLMIGRIGLAPINSLEGDYTADVGLAQNILDETSREVQTQGWHFNTEPEYALNRDINGQILLPDNILRVTLHNYRHQFDVVQRGTRLYDRTNRTYTFAVDLTGDVVLELPWEETPQAFRQYCAILAARKFIASALGDRDLQGFSDEDVFRALLALRDADNGNAVYTIFDNLHSQRSLNRHWDIF